MPILRVAWISDFPVEALPGVPEEIRKLPPYNATWQRVLLGELLRHSELDLHIFSIRKAHPYSRSFRLESITVHLIKVPGKIRAPSFFWVDTLLLKRALRRVQPHLVHAWGSELGTGLVASRLGYPYIFTIQGLLTWYREQVPVSSYDRFTAHLEGFSLRRAPTITAESSFPVQFIRTRFPNRRVILAEQAPAWLFHSVKRDPQTKPLRFIFVGSFNYRKGADLLLQTLDSLKTEFSFELNVLGSVDPAYRKRLESLTSVELWKLVHFRFNLSPAEIASELGRATMMLFPTRADTGPIAVKEAVVAGVPVIGSSIGGIPDYITPEKNGLIFQPDSISACLTAVRAACRHRLFSLGRVDETMLAEKREYLSPERMAQTFLQIYKEVSEENRPRHAPADLIKRER